MTEQLTLEALLARLQARKPAPPLYLHASLSEVVSVSRQFVWKVESVRHLDNLGIVPRIVL